MEESHYEAMYVHERAHWWYRVRRSLVRYLISRYAGDAELRILDVGCGTGLLLKELAAFGDVQGIDVSQLAIDFCNERGLSNVALGNATAIPFPDNSFDIVLALDVIEHVADDATAAREIRRVLKPGGTAIVFVPAFRFLWGITDELSRHYRRYTLPELRRVFERVGCTVQRASYFNFLLFPAIFAVRGCVRLFGLRVGSEFESNNRMLNELLYHIFNLEYWLLRAVNLPFGVSALVVVQK